MFLLNLTQANRTVIVMGYKQVVNVFNFDFPVLYDAMTPPKPIVMTTSVQFIVLKEQYFTNLGSLIKV